MCTQTTNLRLSVKATLFKEYLCVRSWKQAEKAHDRNERSAYVSECLP